MDIILYLFQLIQYQPMPHLFQLIQYQPMPQMYKTLFIIPLEHIIFHFYRHRSYQVLHSGHWKDRILFLLSL